MYYTTLGNLASLYEEDGTGPLPGGGLSNTGPFSNLLAYVYWSGTGAPPMFGVEFAYRFGWHEGFQGKGHHVGGTFLAWAVRDGDVGVPLSAPSTLTLICLGTAWALRRRREADCGA